MPRSAARTVGILLFNLVLFSIAACLFYALEAMVLAFVMGQPFEFNIWLWPAVARLILALGLIGAMVVFIVFTIKRIKVEAALAWLLGED